MALLRPRTAFGSRAAQSGINTPTKRMESRMNFAIDSDTLFASQARGFDRRNAARASRERLSVLFVTPFLPSPPSFGAQRRLHELISGVAATHDTSVLSPVDPTQNQEEAI